MNPRMFLCVGTMAAATCVAVHPGVSAGAATPVPFGLFQASNNLQYSFPATPEYAVQYYSWQENLQAADVQAAWNQGTESFLELQTCGNPCNTSTSVSLTSVVDGDYDSYLTSFADAINAFGHPVLLTFDHEMNGGSYPWDTTDNGTSTGVTAALWKEAWDHVTSVIINIARKYVTWVWAPDVELYGAPFAPYWPGTAGGLGENVGLQGLDGYLGSPQSSWANTFASSVSAIKQLGGNHYQFVVSETGVDASDSNVTAQVSDLVTNVRAAAGANGFVIYFDSGKWAMTSQMETAFIQDVA